VRTESEFRALLVLLGDDDERVAGVARAALLEAREAAVPFLTEASSSPDPRMRGRARLLLEELRVLKLEAEWEVFGARPDDDIDLEEGAILVSGLARTVDPAAVGSFLDAIAGMVRAHMVTVDPVQALGEVLFENLGFKGGDYEEIDNYYLVPALERRTGIPIVLGALYVLVGRRLNLPVAGVAAPSHYLVRVERPGGPLFVDCYNRGRLYREDTLCHWLEGRGLSGPEQYLGPCSTRFTLLRMMNNLERQYGDQNDVRMKSLVRRLRGYLEPNR
jgi:regulator of sirC expression with transglutaminase-like and TPR domain